MSSPVGIEGKKNIVLSGKQQSPKVRLKCSETSTSDRIFLNLERITIFKFKFIDNFERQKRKLIRTTEWKPSPTCILLSQVRNPLGPRYIVTLCPDITNIFSTKNVQKLPLKFSETFFFDGNYGRSIGSGWTIAITNHKQLQRRVQTERAQGEQSIFKSLYILDKLAKKRETSPKIGSNNIGILLANLSR